METEVQRIIRQFDLVPLPREGGWFRPTWRTTEGSAIYFLITPEGFSALHRLRQDELWHFYAGDPVEHVVLQGSEARTTRLGGAVLAGEVPQLTVPAGAWQGARLARAERGWALLGCTLAPAWEERDFELAERAALQREFPAHAELVRALTR